MTDNPSNADVLSAVHEVREIIRDELKAIRADFRNREELLRREMKDLGEELRRRADAAEARIRMLELDRKMP